MLLLRRTALSRALGPITVGIFLLAALMAPNAGAAIKTAAASLTPGSANAGATTRFTLSVSPTQGTLGSITLIVPEDGFARPRFVIDGNVTVSSGTALVSPTQIEVVGLKISPSQSLTVGFDATPPCTPTPESSYAWNLSAFERTGSAYTVTQPATSVSSTSDCRLVFTAGPQDALTGQTITTTDFNMPAGGPIQVSVFRDDSTVDTTFTGTIQLFIETDPGANDATLSGGTSSAPVDGAASFTPALDVAGIGYVLEACNPTVNEVTSCAQSLEDAQGFLSEMFTIQNSLLQCESPSGCPSLSVTGSGLQVSSARVSASNAQAGNFITVGVWSVGSTGPTAAAASGITTTIVAGTLDCPGYDEITDEVVSFAYSGTGTKTVTLTITQEAMQALEPSNGVAHVQICFGSTIPFVTRDGSLTGPEDFDPTLGLYVGLLPNCPGGGVDPSLFAPCVISRTAEMAGQGVITYNAAGGDPAGRG